MPVSVSIAEQRLRDALVDRGLVTREKVEVALAERQRRGYGKSLGSLLVELGHVGEEDLLAAYGELYNLPVMADEDLAPSLAAMSLVPEELVRRHKLFPLILVEGELTVGITDPLALHVTELLRERTRCQIQPVLISTASFLRLLEQFFVSGRVPSRPGGDAEASGPDIRELERAGRAMAVVDLVDKILAKAVSDGASDIHIEAAESRTVVRYRIDGILHEELGLSRALHAGIVSRVKILANLDIAERRVPQDGRIKVQLAGRDVDLRVSTLPTLFGEKVVLRILDRTRAVVPLDRLGLADANLELLRRLISQPHGLVLVTGPTGSGKTTTLYSALSALDAVRSNILTVEDPVEYQLPGINQVPVNPRQGLTFAAALRSILRQDPDVVLVGEIRDPETGTIAAEAALTGHLVLSTLHTNDAPSSVHRLEEIGVPPYLLAPSLSGVVAQRLVRRICPGCREPYEATAEELVALGVGDAGRRVVCYRGAGCRACGGRGYRGRLGIHEIFAVDAALRDMIAARAPEGRFRAALAERGFLRMRLDGLRKIVAGETTVEEVLRVTKDVG